MILDNFIKNNEHESFEFKALINILATLNPYVREGRKLLCLVNNIIDYYICRETDSNKGVKMPIIYFPLCEEWAQSLCEEFVALKISLLWGDSTRINLQREYENKPYIYIPENSNKKVQAALTKQFKFKKAVAKYITNDIHGYSSDSKYKCFFFSRVILDEYLRTSKKNGYYHFSYDLDRKSVV